MSMILDGSNGVTFPSWTTSNRPSSPTTAMTGYNTTLNVMEVYTGTTWIAVGEQSSYYSIDFLVVGGGGGGGCGTNAGNVEGGGGGGAGGFRTSTQTATVGTVITVTVGDGGAGTTTAGANGTSGVASSISGSGLTTISSLTSSITLLVKLFNPFF